MLIDPDTPQRAALAVIGAFAALGALVTLSSLSWYYLARLVLPL